MRSESIVTAIHCDRCHSKGNPEYPNRQLRWFSTKLVIPCRVTQGVLFGWWLGKKWDLCPKCKVIENKQSRAGRSKIINLNEQREAV